MISIRKALALGALAVAAGLVGTQPAWAQLGRRAVAQPVPAAPTPMVTLLSIGNPTVAPATITPTAAPHALGQPPISQPIPGPVINN